MTATHFVDSNVWVYFFADDDPDKKSRAIQFVYEAKESGIAVVSWQVVNEVCKTLVHKKRKSESFIRVVMDFICGSCTIVDFTAPLLEQASNLRERHGVSFWDSLIVSAALSAGCETLVSEDMQDGMRFNGLTVRNIFA